MSEEACAAQQSSPAAPVSGVPGGTKTSDVYEVGDIPARFDNPGKISF